MILATWLIQAADEEQTSVLVVILKVYNYLWISYKWFNVFTTLTWLRITF